MPLAPLRRCHAAPAPAPASLLRLLPGCRLRLQAARRGPSAGLPAPGPWSSCSVRWTSASTVLALHSWWSQKGDLPVAWKPQNVLQSAPRAQFTQGRPL